MQFYVRAEGSGVQLVFPMNPEEFTATFGARVTTLELLGPATVAIPRGKSPDRVSWRGVLPGRARRTASFVVPGAWQEPKAIVDQVKAWRDAGQRLFLFITETSIAGLMVFVERFEVRGSGGYGDVQYQIELTETASVTVAPTTAPKDKEGLVRPVPPPARTYRVRAGEGFYDVARRTLGKPGRWREIWALNRRAVPNPDTLAAGTVLRIPA